MNSNQISPTIVSKLDLDDHDNGVILEEWDRYRLSSHGVGPFYIQSKNRLFCVHNYNSFITVELAENVDKKEEDLMGSVDKCTPKKKLKRGDSLELRVAKKYISLRDSAHSRGHDFDLSLADLKRIMKRKKCFYTGLDLVDSGRPKANESTPYNSFTLDRINPKLGYVPGNVVPCCFAVNQLKEKLEHSDKDGLSLAHKMKLMKKLLEVL